MATRRVSRSTSALALAALVCGGCASLTTVTADGIPVSKSVERYVSGDRAITVDHYTAHAVGGRPAVILAYGSGGLWFTGGRRMGRYARSLAARGFETFVVHYFDATGSLYATGRSERRNFARWVKALSDGVTYVSREPTVDSSHVSILGVSLGAYLAVGLGAEDRRISALVGIAGGLEPFLAGRVTRLPTTLILHGDQDRVVPFAEAFALAQYLSRHGLPVEIRIYPGQDHEFDDSAEADALARVTSFLLKAASDTAS